MLPHADFIVNLRNAFSPKPDRSVLRAHWRENLVFRVSGFQPDQTSVGIGTLCGWKHFVKSWLSASGFCGTILIPYISCLAKQLETILPGMKNYAHLKHQPSDYYRLNILGASVFAHIGVDARGTGRSIGVPNFQVRETMRTWNIIGLTNNMLLFQVRIC